MQVKGGFDLSNLFQQLRTPLTGLGNNPDVGKGLISARTQGTARPASPGVSGITPGAIERAISAMAPTQQANTMVGQSPTQQASQGGSRLGRTYPSIRLGNTLGAPRGGATDPWTIIQQLLAGRLR